jgi:hypothetical protein
MVGLALMLLALGIAGSAAALVRRRAVNAMFILAEIGAIGLLVFGNCAGARRLRQERLARLAAEAKADSQVNWYRGQLQYASRLIVQRTVQIDGDYRARRPVVHTVFVTAPSTIRDSSHGTTMGDTLHGELDARQDQGVLVRASVVPSQALWQWEVQRAPTPFTVVLSCERGGAARATISGPRWANIGLGELQQDPNICNPPIAGWQPFSFKPPSLPWIAAIAGGLLLLRR